MSFQPPEPPQRPHAGQDGSPEENASSEPVTPQQPTEQQREQAQQQPAQPQQPAQQQPAQPQQPAFGQATWPPAGPSLSGPSTSAPRPPQQQYPQAPAYPQGHPHEYPHTDFPGQPVQPPLPLHQQRPGEWAQHAGQPQYSGQPQYPGQSQYPGGYGSYPGGPSGPTGPGGFPPPPPRRGLPAWAWWTIGGGVFVIVAAVVVLALLLAAALAPRSTGAEAVPVPTPAPSQGESAAPPEDQSVNGVLPLDAYYQVDGAPDVSVTLPDGWTQITFDEQGINAWSNDALGCRYSVESVDFDASNTSGDGAGDLPSTRSVALDDIDRFGEQLSNTAIVGDNGRANVPTSDGNALELLVTTMAYTSQNTDGPAGLYSGLRVAAESNVLVNLLLTCEASTLQSADNPWTDLVSRTLVARP